MRLDTFQLLEAAEEGALVLRPSGDLDYHSALPLRAWVEANLKSPLPTVLVDLSDVAFIDSGGLGALIGMWKRFTGLEHTVLFISPSPQLARLLTITGLSGRLPVYDTAQEAFASIRYRPPDASPLVHH
ncbi:STAS domain-containing protein [Streptosporangium sp. KLBMP 9127]|nr:STAS domain-containing protein [Streptosporangium sp. KLBMP 9127]